MRTALAIILAVASLAGCGDGRYQIAAGGDTFGVWRLDTRSGEVAWCSFHGHRYVRCLQDLEAPTQK